MENCAVKGLTCSDKWGCFEMEFFSKFSNCTWTQNICETPALNALGQACKETEKLDL